MLHVFATINQDLNSKQSFNNNLRGYIISMLTYYTLASSAILKQLRLAPWWPCAVAVCSGHGCSCGRGPGEAALQGAGHQPAWECQNRAWVLLTSYQCDIYPSESFAQVQKYGLTFLVTTDCELLKNPSNVVEQLKDCLFKCSVQKLVVVISNTEQGEGLERWQFDIEYDKAAKDDNLFFRKISES